MSSGQVGAVRIINGFSGGQEAGCIQRCFAILDEIFCMPNHFEDCTITSFVPALK